MQTKTNLNNDKVVVKNTKDYTTPALNVYNFNSQGQFPLGGTNAGIVLHNYTDAPAMQIDNVGANAGLIINMANNSTNRPDKDPTYCGDGNFISVVQTYFNGGNKATKNPWRLNNRAEFEYNSGYKPYMRIKGNENINESCFSMLCEQPHRNTFSLTNSNLNYLTHTNNTQDYSYNYTSTRHSIFNFGNTGQAQFNNNVTTGYSYVFNGVSKDGTVFKINNEIVLRINENANFVNATQFKR